MLINNFILPLCLAVLMFLVGAGLNWHSFKPLMRQPRLVLLGMAMQLLVLPALAWLLIIVFNLEGALALGLVLIAAAPGGATSNLFTHLAAGEVALSVTLTASVSLLAPVWIPLALGVQLNWLGLAASLHLPWLKTLLQLLLVTGLPLVLGMWWRFKFTQRVQALHKPLKIIAAGVLGLMLLLLMVANAASLQAALNVQAAVMVLLLASLALSLGYGLALWLRLTSAQAKCLSFETGVQNAGVAILVAFTQLQQTEAGLVALLYGFLMNAPALVALFLLRKK